MHLLFIVYHESCFGKLNMNKHYELPSRMNYQVVLKAYFAIKQTDFETLHCQSVGMCRPQVT